MSKHSFLDRRAQDKRRDFDEMLEYTRIKDIERREAGQLKIDNPIAYMEYKKRQESMVLITDQDSPSTIYRSRDLQSPIRKGGGGGTQT